MLALRQAFYRFPKLVYHIDEGAVAALTRYYDAAVPDPPCLTSQGEGVAQSRRRPPAARESP